MSWQSDIVSSILDDPGLSGMIGGRVFADIADRSASPPYLVYSVPSSIGETAFDGSRGVFFPLVQFSIWAETREKCIQISSSLRQVMEGRNLPGENNVSLGYSNESSGYDEEAKLYGEILEYRASATPN